MSPENRVLRLARAETAVEQTRVRAVWRQRLAEAMTPEGATVLERFKAIHQGRDTARVEPA